MAVTKPMSRGIEIGAGVGHHADATDRELEVGDGAYPPRGTEAQDPDRVSFEGNLTEQVGVGSVAGTEAVEGAVAEAYRRFASRRPRTEALHGTARRVLPGGNTRTVLFHRPFPLRVARAWGSVLQDLDGHEYVDLLGEYSAGLYGHSHPIIAEAMTSALAEGISRGAHTAHEVLLAEAVVERFDSIEQVRFTNSGTEANLMALSAARAFTGRDRVMAFLGGYHGGLLTFAAGRSPVNAPYDVVLAAYNDPDEACTLLRQHAEDVACVLVEPMLGSAGCIPGDLSFLQALRDTTREVGALLVFDEVMTSRTGGGGLQHRLGISPDLTTLGKYVGGGASFGAFGGREDVMALFDPTRPGALPHAGTFNNNVLSMAAGYAGLSRVYTPEVAERHTARGDALRRQLSDVFAEARVPMTVTGVGSLMAVHPVQNEVRSPLDLQGADPRVTELLFLDLLEQGYYIAPRGYLALSLAVDEEQLSGFVEAVGRAVAGRASLFQPCGR